MRDKEWQEILGSKPDGERLVHCLENIESKAKPLLSKIVETFPDYTEHDIEHSKRILGKLKKVVSKSLKEKLSAYEIYFLIAGAYLHDIGMVNFPELIKGLKFTDEKMVRDYIRENHHLRSERFIKKNFKDLSIEDVYQARIIGRISRGHRKENLHDRDLFKPDKMYKGYSINTPLLAALLRIGDELDLTFKRTPLVIYEHVPPRDTISNDEWEKHLAVSGVGLHPEDPLIIKCSATCKNPKIHRALKRLETEINKELRGLPKHLHQYRECRKDLPREFFVEIEAEGYKAYDFRFSLQEKQVVELLMGERLYKRKEESLRELLKNSVDTCRARRELLKKHGLSYTPEIIFKLSPDPNRIIMTDNGIGMDEDIIERYFTKIGQSFYTSPEFLEKGFEFTPVSELGIGFLSCFMIAKKILIETKANDNDPLLIEIDDISDYFLVRQGKREDTGTSVTLFLKEDIKEIDLEKEIRYYARHLEFPVKIVLPSGEYIIKDVDFKIDANALLKGYLTRTLGFHLIEIDDEYVDGVVAVAFEKDDKLVLKPPDNIWKYYYGWSEKFGRRENRILISNEGLLVGHEDLMPKWLSVHFIFMDLNIKKNALDLNVARNDLVRNDKFDKFGSRLEKILINGFRKFLIALERKAMKADVYFPTLSNKFFEGYIEYTRVKALEKEGKLSNEFLDLVRSFCYFECITGDGVTYKKYDEIMEISKPLIILEELHEYDEEYIRQIFCGCSGFSEKNLHLIGKYPFSVLAGLLFEKARSKNFLTFISKARLRELDGIIPKTWRLMRFFNYETPRFIEFSHGTSTILNRENKFIDLLIRNKHILTRDKRIALLGFFRSLKMDLKGAIYVHGFTEVLSKQKAVLQWFVDAQLISKDEINDYVFKRSDFPPHLLHW